MSFSDQALPFQGLSTQEVTTRLQTEGLNQLPAPSPTKEFFKSLLTVLKEPMLFLLTACAVLYLSLGDISGAAVLFSFVLFVILITLYQERRTEKALAALRDLSSPKAKVIRDGTLQQIESKFLVRGDIFLLSEGERIPADAHILECTNLLVDESLLTGESLPVNKNSMSHHVIEENYSFQHPEEHPTSEKEKQDNQLKFSSVYSGTLVVRGQGFAEVVRVGIQTQMGQIGNELATLETEKTPLQKETKRLVVAMASIGLAACFIVFLIYGIKTGQYRKGLLASLALAMSVLPEELPMILTVFLALGAWRMSKNQVLTRRGNAIEALGSTTVLCVDKTGTLTLNKMTVQMIYAEDQDQFYGVNSLDAKSLSPAISSIIQYSILASEPTPFDPMEIAFHELGKERLKENPFSSPIEFIKEYPLSPQLFAMTRVYSPSDENSYIVASKGAPEAIFLLCKLPEEQKTKLLKKTAEMAEQGLRVLAVAQSYYPKQELPAEQHGFSFSFLGLLGLADPVREEAKQVITACKDARIRMVMITGDHPSTAKSIARQIGLTSEGGILTGSELDVLDSSALQKKLKTINLFVRVSPQQKLRLVNELKEMGEIVAMTGDGVNDAPALKAAHIGVAMGNRGTDVAREAASVVLLDDNISSWITAISMGRRIWDNVKKAIIYTMGIHVAIAGLALFPLFLHWPLVLLPVQIAMLEMVIDPACSLIFESDEGEQNLMHRPPRNPNKALFDMKAALVSILQGSWILLLCLLTLGFAMWQKRTDEEARTFTFFTLMLGNLGLIFVNRSQHDGLLTILRKRNLALFIVIGAVIFVASLILLIPPLQRLFSFGSLSFTELGMCLLAGLLALLGCEGIKKLLQWLFRKKI